jgi:prepilin-type N-terminal cleavage/methylation domain-containing protein
MKRLLGGDGGFTLAELLVVVGILGLIMAALFTMQDEGQRAYLTGAARVEVQQNARVGLDTILSDIRVALPQPGTTQMITAIDANCSLGLEPANGGRLLVTPLSFTALREPDAAHNPADYHGHPVSYRLNGANLERTENGVTDVVIGGVQEVRVWCYDGKGALGSALGEIRELRIQIRARAETPAAAGSPGDQRTVAEGRVRFRNI